MNAERIEEIRKLIEDARAFGHGVGVLALDVVPELLAEIDWMRKELAQCHRQIELADEQLAQYGDVKRKLHELQDFIYPDKIEHFRKGETR